ncbi:MAG: hypothetical protein MUO82_08075 [Candidatus Thermoplasmatota archaeon]|nr:hypothetical protein [Candidatus Thermoplasmatota archaeon]
MLNKEEILLFLGELISVGVQHTVLPERLFFYYGVLIKVDENALTLRTNDGFKIVPIEQVLDIHTDNWRK